MHKPVDATVSFPQLETQVLDWWNANDVAKRAMALRAGGRDFVFYEGPPTANNVPHFGHVWSRTLKDLWARFATMRGLYVPRKAGWDCHGLPVELAVEAKLGFTRKQQVTEYGVEAFNALCRESVKEYVALWETFSHRLGYWLDYEDAYWTMDKRYMESVWWSLAELHRKGLLFESDRVLPYCPRCETPLSDHELGQEDVYRDVSDPSVYVAFPLREALDGADLVIWTTTPWTLISNLGVAVHPELNYVVAVSDGRRFVVAAELVESALGDSAVIERTLAGAELLGAAYDPPFGFAPASPGAWTVMDGREFVTADEGTGLVHLASFGAEDAALFKRLGINLFNPVDSSGRFDERITNFKGLFVKDADPAIVEDLRLRGRLVRSEDHVHPYPHCWRCKSPLLYYPLTSWFIKTTDYRDRLIEVNSKVNWVPEHLREGRFGNWLRNNVDWSLSRYRFWGTPLPIWRCQEGHTTAIESASDLGAKSGRDLSNLDLHRPFVDEITFACPECRQQSRRVVDLIDVWYDSGAMPFAQHGYPHHNYETFRKQFPAEFIAEATDQTRGWFYTLMAEAVLLFDDTAFRNVVVNGFILDSEGRKMSKSLGNLIDPLETMDRYGSDVMRFYILTAGAVGDNRAMSYEVLEQVSRRPFMTLWNVYRLYVMYANIDGFDPNEWPIIEPALRPELDRWVLSELSSVLTEVTEDLEAYDGTRAGRRITEFVDDLSNWYVRRSRRRFWREAVSDSEEADKSAAYWTLWTCLVELSKLLAPFAPFISESIYRNLVAEVNSSAPESVHLADWPHIDSKLIDPSLSEGMAVARTVASLGHSARASGGVKVRTPLQKAILIVPLEYQAATEQLSAIITDELNVRELEFASEASEFVKVTLRPNYRTAGPDFGDKVSSLAKALADPRIASVASEMAETLEMGQDVDVDLDSGEVLRVSPEHIEVRREPEQGTAFAYQAPYGVSLSLDRTPELLREGIARELVHQLQGERKTLGLEVTDRITLSIMGPEEFLDAVSEHSNAISEELLCTALSFEAGDEDSVRSLSIDGHGVRVWMSRV